MTPKRICMVAYTHYATDPRCRREAEALAARGDSVDFICLSGKGEPSAETVEGVRIRRLSIGRYRGDSLWSYFLSYAWFFVAASFVLFTGHLRRKYDVIHVHTLPDLMVFVSVLPRLMGGRVVLDMHELSPELWSDKLKKHPDGLSIRLLKVIERISLSWADALVLATDPQAELLLARSGWRKPHYVVMNLPDPSLFRCSSGGTRSGPEAGAFKIVHHGTLVHRSGVDIAVRALAEIGTEIPEAQLFIYGAGDFRPAIEQEVRELELQHRVRMSDGMLPLAEIPAAICDAQVGVTPNRNGEIMKLALPSKMLEYMALGIPVIVSKTPAVARYLDDSMVLFFEPGNVSDLARCLLKLYREPEVGRALARNAARFLEGHSWDREKLKLFSLIDSLTT